MSAERSLGRRRGCRRPRPGPPVRPRSPWARSMRLPARAREVFASLKEPTLEEAVTVMKVHELGHIVLYVRDLARSRRFYGELLGWTEITPEDGMPFPAAAFSSG